MGLLDQFSGMSDDQSMGLLSAGLGMMAASGPSRTPTNFGQIALTGLQGYQGSIEAERKRKQDDEMFAEKLAMLKLQERRAQQTFEMQKSAMDGFGGTPAQPAGAMTVPAGSPPDTQYGFTPPVPVAPQARGGEAARLDQLRRMAIAGVPGAKELFDIHKYQAEPQKLEAGATYVDRVTGESRYMPKLDNGFTLGADGSVSVVPGYLQGNADIKGAETNAQEAARARYSTTVVNTPGGPRMVSNADLPSMLSGSRQAPQPPAPLAADAPPGGLNNMTPQQREQLMKRAQAQFDLRPGSQPGTSTTRAPGGLPGIALQTPAQAEAELGAVKTGVEVDKAGRLATQTSQMAAVKLNKQLQAVIPAARTLLEAGPTGSGIGAAIDSALGFFGRATDSGKAADQLDTLSGWLTANVPRMEGPQSNADAQGYKTMAANVGDRSRPASSRLAALASLEQLANKYAEGNGAVSAAPAPQPAKKFNMLPPAAQFDGKRMAADNGTIYRSVGGKWVKE